MGRRQTPPKTKPSSGRFLALALTVAVFLVLCSAIAARPWKQKAPPDPRWAALAARERHLQHEAAVVEGAVRRRWLVYRRQLTKRRAEIAAARKEHEEQLAAAQAA